jgi:uncharacterized protein (TIGR03437 family)
LARDGSGNLFVIDELNYRVRKIDPNGVITTVAGNGTQGYSGDGGLAINAQLDFYKVPCGCGIAIDSGGNIYLSASFHNRIRKISTNGIITSIAGDGTAGYSGDGGNAATAQLNGPEGIAIDGAGSLYVADVGNNRVRKIAPNGVITTVAGTGVSGFFGDGGQATSAQLNYPNGLAVDKAGSLYIAESLGNRIRKVSANGIITTIAGTGATGYSDGPATSAVLDFPTQLAVDDAGNVYIADTFNGAIRVLQPVAATLIITTVNNSASNLPGSVAPGEIVTIMGSGLGPAQLTQYQIGSSGIVSTQLAGTQVSFNGTSAPIIYTWATQVAAIVPYSVSGSNAQVTVTYQGQTTAPVSVPIAPSAPGIFTLDSTGKGAAAVVNQDGSINTAATPAKIGDYISIFATGEGQTTPPGVDGKITTTASLPQPNLPVSVTIGGQTVQPQYAGGAPSEVAGALQVNVQIPTGIQTGNAVPVVLKVGNASSQAGVTISVR